MSNRPVHVLLNPVSGGGRSLRRWRRLEARARAQLAPLHLHSSAGPGDLEATARSLRGEEVVVVAAGGDGTSHEVVNGLVGDGTGPPPRAVLGWLPIGSGNDLARSAGVPRHASGALGLIAGREPSWIDVGRVRYRTGRGPATRIFGNSLTVGLSGAVLDLVSRQRGWLRGNPAYGLAAVRALVTGRPTPLVVTADGRPAFHGSSWLVSITNGARFGAGMLAAPGARVDDGRLHLVTVAGMSRLEALLLFPRIYSGRHLGHPGVTRWSVLHAHIAHDGPLPLELDGELLPAVPPIEVDLVPQALAAITGSQT